MSAKERHLALIDAFFRRGPGPYAGHQAPRGIVIGAGGAKFFGCCWAAIATLRRVGCRLPIEVWHLGRAEMDPEMEAALHAVDGVRIVDAHQVAARLPCWPRILNGWELKPFSVLHSQFREVLYLDADNLAVHDPSYLFESAEFRATGAIFWPDLPPAARAEWLPAACWESVGLTYRPYVDVESGQLLVDRERCWQALALTMLMNEHSDYWYKLVFGDKSTWLLAWVRCGQPYTMIARGAGWEWPAIQQHDPAGRLVFQHACRGKELICAGQPQRNLRHGAWLAEFRESLQRHWSGEIFAWESQRPDERAAAAALCGRYRYERVGIGTRDLVLADGGAIAEGAARCEKRWSYRLLPEGPRLVIVGEAHKQSEIGMMILKEEAPGRWTGRWEAHEKGPVVVERRA